VIIAPTRREHVFPPSSRATTFLSRLLGLRWPLVGKCYFKQMA